MGGSSIGVVIFALLIALMPGARSFFEFDRALILENNQWWRIVTGSFVHWSWEHLFWDCLVFLGVGLIFENQSQLNTRRDKIRMLAWIVLGSICISIVTLLFYPLILKMRGLSGLCIQLYTAVATVLLMSGIREKRVSEVLLGLGALLILLAKIIFEEYSGTAVFVRTTFEGFVVLVYAHVIGALIGIVWGMEKSLK